MNLQLSLFDGYTGHLLSLMTLIVIWVSYKLATRELRRHALGKAYKQENVKNFLFFWRLGWLIVAAIFIVISLSGSLTTLGISAAFLGMVMGWSLQAPVTGLAAWLMLIVIRPFKIGDRVIISGVVGDVVDITLTHIVLNQVGGTVSGEERSGRGVLIPNATMFNQIIHNYTLDSDYLLDEVPVAITYESDFDEAESILLAAARKVTEGIIRKTKQEPFVRAEFTDSGLRVRLRYLTVAKDRQRVSSEIVKIIFREFNKSKKVEFCYPHTEILYGPKESVQKDG